MLYRKTAFCSPLASKPCSEAANTGYRFSSWADSDWILFELNSKNQAQLITYIYKRLQYI